MSYTMRLNLKNKQIRLAQNIHVNIKASTSSLILVIIGFCEIRDTDCSPLLATAGMP